MDKKEAEKKSVHLEMRNLKLTELQSLKNRAKKIEREGGLRERKGLHTRTITRKSASPIEVKLT